MSEIFESFVPKSFVIKFLYRCCCFFFTSSLSLSGCVCVRVYFVIDIAYRYVLLCTVYGSTRWLLLFALKMPSVSVNVLESRWVWVLFSSVVIFVVSLFFLGEFVCELFSWCDRDARARHICAIRTLRCVLSWLCTFSPYSYITLFLPIWHPNWRKMNGSLMK